MLYIAQPFVLPPEIEMESVNKCTPDPKDVFSFIVVFIVVGNERYSGSGSRSMDEISPFPARLRDFIRMIN